MHRIRRSVIVYNRYDVFHFFLDRTKKNLTWRYSWLCRPIFRHCWHDGKPKN